MTAVNLTKIPKNEQENVLSSFWTMLMECESKAHVSNDIILRRWVEQWFSQWNRITGDDKQPRWMKK